MIKKLLLKNNKSNNLIRSGLKQIVLDCLKVLKKWNFNRINLKIKVKCTKFESNQKEGSFTS